MSGAVLIRKAVGADHAGVLGLYKLVAATPGGIARTPAEVSSEYVSAFMHKAALDGLQFVAEQEGRIVGEIHAVRAGIACFAHVLGDLTVAVSPACQGQGVGRRLFMALLDEVGNSLAHITRVELFVRESNGRARALYESLGFEAEGSLRGRVNDAAGVPECDIVMGWLRPRAGAAASR